MIYEKFKLLNNFNGFTIKDKTYFFKPISLEKKYFLENNYKEIKKDKNELIKILEDCLITKIDNEDDEILNRLFDLLSKGISINYYHDFYLENILKNFMDNKDSISSKYVGALLAFGYKYLEIKKMTDTDIIECAINEIGIRNENDLYNFLNPDITEKTSESLVSLINEIKKEVKETEKKALVNTGKDAYSQLLSL